LNRRLLATAVAGFVLVVSAILVASMDGNDKPVVTTNPPPADGDEPQNAQVNPTPDAETTPPPDDADDVANDDQEEDQDDQDEPELPEDEGKAHGLQTAIQAHIKNMEKTEMKGKSTPPGLESSLQLLTEMYAGVLAGEKASGNANGHNKGA